MLMSPNEKHNGLIERHELVRSNGVSEGPRLVFWDCCLSEDHRAYPTATTSQYNFTHVSYGLKEPYAERCNRYEGDASASRGGTSLRDIVPHRRRVILTRRRRLSPWRRRRCRLPPLRPLEGPWLTLSPDSPNPKVQGVVRPCEE